MWSLTSAFLDIALHRRGPDSLPSSRFLVGILLACHVPLGLFVLYLRNSLNAQDLGFFLIDLGLYIAFVFAVLRFFKLDSRLLQTLTALFGTEIVINALSVPVGIVGRGFGVEESQSALIWVYLALLLWWIDVTGYILAKAIDQSYIVGLMFVILYVMTSLSIYSYLVETPAG